MPAARSQGQRCSSRGIRTARKLAQRFCFGLDVVVYSRVMRNVSQTTPRRILCRCALAAGLLACLALPGCNEANPLEAIRQQQAIGDFEGSVEPLRELLATRPDDPEVNILYGRALAFTQRQNLASWSFRNAMRDPEWLVQAGSQLA